MPIYEYECMDCGRIEEAFQKISDEPLKVCRHCNGRLHKLISQSSFHLKGSGWYVTDYGGSSGKGCAAPKPSETTDKTCAKSEKAPEKTKNNNES